MVEKRCRRNTAIYVKLIFIFLFVKFLGKNSWEIEYWIKLKIP